MTLARGQSAAVGYSSAGSTTTGAMTTGVVTNLLVFVIEESGNSTPPVVTDSKANTYVHIATHQVIGTGYSVDPRVHAYRCIDATGGSGHTVTCAKANGYASLFVVEITGSAAFADYTLQQTGLNPHVSIPNTAATGSMAVAFLGGSSSATSFDWGGGFIDADEITSTSFWQGSTATQLISAAGDVTASCTVSAANPAAIYLIELTDADGGTSHEVVIAEAAAVGDTNSAAPVWLAGILESVAAGDVPGAASALVADVSESIAALDGSATLTDIVAFTVEPAAVGDVLAGGAVYALVVIEAAGADEQAVAQAIVLAVLTEATAAAEGLVGLQDGAASAVDSLAVTDVLQGTGVVVQAGLESIVAADGLSAQSIAVAVQTESVPSGDVSISASGGDGYCVEVATAQDDRSAIMSAVVISVNAATVADGSHLVRDVDALIAEALTVADLSVTTRTLVWMIPSMDRIARVRPAIRFANVVTR